MISAGLIIWLGQMLFKNGRVFLLDAFDGHQVMADSVNRLLIVGFYLINFGIVSLFLKFGSRPGDMVDFIELMSVKIGIVLLILGVRHVFNMFNIVKMRCTRRRKALRKKSQPAPVAPAQS